MRRPDFFIAGAPKCATTSMDHYLRQHPEIFMCRKEIHYFGKDLRPRRPRARTEEEYLAYFASAKDEKRLGETAIYYLYSETAAAEIRAFDPDARILVMLRNPVDLMYALHAQLVGSGKEEILDFEDALGADDERRNGRRRSEHEQFEKPIVYRDLVRFPEQVRRFFDAFGRERVHVVISEDLRHDVPKVFREICEFLDVDPGFEPDFRSLNPSHRVRSIFLVRLLRKTSPTGRLLRRAARAVPLGLGLLARAKAWNRPPARREALRPELRAALLEEVRPEVLELGELLGRDLTGWLESPATAGSSTLGDAVARSA